MEKNIAAWDAMMSNVAGLPEIERLRAENAAMRPIVQRVAEHTAWPNFRADLYMCLFCTAAAGHLSDLQHDANCIAEQARAFVAQHPAQEKGRNA